jgi:UDP-glucose 4-epimerase
VKILITGGAGFVGSHLCDKYTKEGNIVVCLDNFMSGNLVNIRHLLSYKNFKLINGDVRDFDLLEKIIADVEVVFHLAAQIHVDRSIIEPKLTYDINISGTQNILELARRYDVRKVIHASTSEVYGTAQYTPMNEKHPLDAPHPYGASKIAADRMCYAYKQTYGIDIAIMRLFNIFGPRQRDTGYGGVISIFVRRALSGMPPIIYGDGKQTRDYSYIEDALSAYDAVLNYNGVFEGPINFGTGKEVEIGDLANRIIKLTGQQGKIKPVYVEPRPGEVQRLIADISQAKKLLKWEPKCTLEEGLERFIDWYRDYKFEEWSKPG